MVEDQHARILLEGEERQTFHSMDQKGAATGTTPITCTAALSWLEAAVAQVKTANHSGVLDAEAAPVARIPEATATLRAPKRELEQATK